jgi:hypothetical protein
VISLGVAAVARHDRQTALKTWREALARYPASREAHFLMLAYLSPAAGGSRMHVIEFLDAIRARTPSEAPSAAVELAAIVEQHIGAVSRGGVEALMARDHWAQPPVRLILDRALAFWLTPGFLKHAAALADLNILAFALVGAERYDDAGRVFRALGGTVTPWPWRSEGDPVSVFERRQDRCLR